jgi:hypothetical protein
LELVSEFSGKALVRQEPVTPGDPDEDPFCSFWKGEDPRIHAELCELLSQQGIPCKTIRRQDHLFNMNTQNAFEIGIPFSQFEKAEAAVQEAYGGSGEPTKKENDSTFALPESTEPSDWHPNWDPDDWCPEDATIAIWTDNQPEMAELLGAALGENRIHARVAEMDGVHRVFVLPEDEARAREIVREVVEGLPPE